MCMPEKICTPECHGCRGMVVYFCVAATQALLCSFNAGRVFRQVDWCVCRSLFVCRSVMVAAVWLGTSVLLQRQRCCVVLMLVEFFARLIGVYAGGNILYGCHGCRGMVVYFCVAETSVLLCSC